MTLECPLIEVSGAPYERGLQYGRAAASRISLSVGHYTRQLEQIGARSGSLSRLARQFAPIIEAFDSTYIEEMRGIAKGANVDFEAIVLVNARTEFLKLAVRPQSRVAPLAEGDPDGCTCIVVQPPVARAGRLIHAHNWDWKVESAETTVVLKVRREDGPDFLTFTEAGALARFGVNTLGLAITANYLECERDYTQIGTPLTLIRRKVLEQQHLALAIRAITATPKCGSNNITLTHSKGMVFNFECAPDEAFRVEPRDGLLTHANHWQSPVALSKLKDTGVGSFPDSQYRDQRARALLEPKLGAIETDDVKHALFDDFAAPYSICRPPRPSATTNLSATVAMIVMDSAAGTMEVGMLPASNRRFHCYTLSPVLHGVQAAR